MRQGTGGLILARKQEPRKMTKKSRRGVAMRDGAVVAGGWERAGGGTLGKFLGRARVVAEADFEAAGAVFSSEERQVRSTYLIVFVGGGAFVAH